MRPIIKWTFWQRRWSTVWWCAGVAAFIILNLAFYPAVRDQANELNKSFEQIPQSAKAFITDTGDFLSPEGYLSSQVFYLMLPMLLGVLAISLGSSLIAKEENDGTIELLLSRPVSRAKLLAAKAATGFLVLLAVGAASLITVVIMGWLVDIEVPLGNIALVTLLCTLFALALGNIAFYMSAIGRRGRLASIGVAALVGLGGYIITSLTSLASWLEWPDKLLPFHYYRPSEVLSGSYPWLNSLVFVGIVVVLGVLSWVAFRRRDTG